MEKQNDLIVALATPDAISAIALVRLSGRGASKTVEKLMHLKHGKLSGRKRAVGDFSGVDYLVAISWPHGQSYTGEEMVDLMCHGSPGTVMKVIDLLINNGARQAEAGEFTRRAWINGKLSSLDILSLSAQYNNKEKNKLKSDFSEDLSILTSEIEGLIEFSEDFETSEEAQLQSVLHQVLLKANTLEAKVKQVEILPRVFIMGPVNAGKSTLFNKLFGSDLVVVSPTPGTTRDGATRLLSISGRTVEISDSAGFGGQDLDGVALEYLKNDLKLGDRIIWMDPLCNTPELQISEPENFLLVKSKVDLENSKSNPNWISYSSTSGSGYSEIVNFITRAENESSSWKLARIIELLENALAAVDASDIAFAAEIVRDVLIEAEEHYRCGDAVERALERFCVGK